MTTVTKLGQTPEKKELKKIEFVSALDKQFNKTIVSANPCDYKSVVLLFQGYMGNYDLIRCEGYGYTHLFIGHFNDGVV